MGMGTKSWDWEGMGTRKSFPHISTVACVRRLTMCYLPPTKNYLSESEERSICFRPHARVRLSVCLSVSLLARLLKNACMDLDEMLHVDRCRDMNELINFWDRSGTGTATLQRSPIFENCFLNVEFCREKQLSISDVNGSKHCSCLDRSITSVPTNDVMFYI